MSADKLFTVAGTATNSDGTTKARFANDLVARIKRKATQVTPVTL